MPACWKILIAAVAFSLAPSLRAQQTPTTTSPYTLHVYEDLVQVPTLILNRWMQPMLGLDKDQIAIRLDSGPPFSPPHMHMEGNEPLALGLLIDASNRNERQQLDTLKNDAGEAAASTLSQQDHITVFAVDCVLIRAGLDLPATPKFVQDSVDSALSAPALHHGKKHPACGHTVALWDAAAVAVEDLAQQHGRKVLLMISDGYDARSTNNWNAVRTYAAEQGVAIFALRSRILFTNPDLLQHSTPGAGGVLHVDSKEDPLGILCASTGGWVLLVKPSNLTGSIEKVIDMVRSRYMLEFPRPNDEDPGLHSIAVHLTSIPGYVSTAGVAYKIVNEDQRADETVVPSAPSPAVMGKRRPLISH